VIGRCGYCGQIEPISQCLRCGMWTCDDDMHLCCEDDEFDDEFWDEDEEVFS
jgi:hypothetical protein